MRAARQGSRSRRPEKPESDAAARRSDEIRQRRVDQARKPARRSAAYKTPEPPPVMARGYGGGAPIQGSDTRRSQLARRRYDVMLNAQGGTMRLPSLPQIRLGWRLASFLVFCVLVFGLYQLWNAPMYRVEEAQIAGLQRLSSGAVSAVLDLKDQPVFALDTQEMEQTLLNSFPEFSAVQVLVEMPNTVMITVTERVPVLVWRQDGRTNLVDAGGMLFPAREDSAAANLPVVEAAGSPPFPQALAAPTPAPSELLTVNPLTTNAVRPFMASEMVSAILLIAGKAPEGAVLLYDPQHGLGWRDRREWNVYFGQVTDIEVKLRVYRSILDHLKAQDMRPSLISVEYLHAPYYRLQQP